MSEVEFSEENPLTTRRPAVRQAQPFMVRILIKTGLVSTQRAAYNALLAIAVLAVVATIFIMSNFVINSSGKPGIPVPYDETYNVPYR